MIDGEYKMFSAGFSPDHTLLHTPPCRFLCQPPQPRY